MKLLYLDFDGVLHHEAVYFHPKRGVHMVQEGHTLFEWMPILDELLAPHPDVKIVLSTSWVRIKSFQFAKKRLSPMLQERVVGATFHHRHMQKATFSMLPRGVQIEGDVFRRPVQSWFALDDDYVNWPAWCRDNLIKTDGTLGISAQDIQYALRIMLERF